MNNSYLWDRSGARDPEVERLEHLLGPLRREHLANDLPVERLVRPRSSARSWRWYFAPFALAASIALLVAGTWWNTRSSLDVWNFEPMSGTPTVGAIPLLALQGARLDQWLETDASSTARLSASDVGEVEIGPASRVRLATARRGEHRLELLRGSLHAYVWAKPGQFFVDTPSATAIDLGCAYTLNVDSSGDGRLHVTAGWVGLEHDRRISFVPAGGTCVLKRGRGPGTPHLDDVPSAMAGGLATLDSSVAADATAAALDVVLAEARPGDAFTLWHLLSRPDRRQAERVYDRLAQLAPPPASVRRDLVLAGDRVALDAWWDSLGLGEAALFRTWKLRPASR